MRAARRAAPGTRADRRYAAEPARAPGAWHRRDRLPARPQCAGGMRPPGPGHCRTAATQSCCPRGGQAVPRLPPDVLAEGSAQLMSGNPAAALVNRLPAAAARWVSDARDDIRSHPAAIDELFAVASRHCGRAPLPDDGSGPGGWTADDAVRGILLDALPLRGPRLLEAPFRLYRHGDTARSEEHTSE